jgi:hypothetical protein
MALHPDIIKVAHLSEFEVDMNLLRPFKDLGSGGFGKVKLMVDKNSNAFAVKYCSFGRGPKEFRCEIESMCRSFHPCVARGYSQSDKVVTSYQVATLIGTLTVR